MEDVRERDSVWEFAETWAPRPFVSEVELQIRTLCIHNFALCCVRILFPCLVSLHLSFQDYGCVFCRSFVTDIFSGYWCDWTSPLRLSASASSYFLFFISMDLRTGRFDYRVVFCFQGVFEPQWCGQSLFQFVMCRGLPLCEVYRSGLRFGGLKSSSCSNLKAWLDQGWQLLACSSSMAASGMCKSCLRRSISACSLTRKL